MKKESVKTIWIVTVFAIAMGFLEAAVVVYLRYLYYPAGFAFPLKGFIDPAVLGVEWVREFSTIVMLVTIGMLAGKKVYSKFAYFIYSFAIWDIFYYVFLKMTLGWPESLLTMDMLFMIPWPWVGPVLAPVICSIVMIGVAFFLIHYEDKGKKMRVKTLDVVLVLVGIGVILYTWLVDYGQILINGRFLKDFFSLATNKEFANLVASYMPLPYSWGFFILGVVISSIGLGLFCRRIIKK